MKVNRLTKVEEEIMMMIWQESEPITVSQLIAKMEPPHPPHSTISSIVRILEKKGFVGHKAYGRTHVYFSVIVKKDYTRFSLSGLVSDYFGGSTPELVSFLIQEKNLSLKDLNEIMQQLGEQE